jgi:Lar family restriction alleviation protein
MDKLKPCPFCQSAGVSLSYSTDPTGETINGRFVECESCAANGPVCGTEAEAITAWNTRTPNSVITELVEAARDAHEMLARYCGFLGTINSADLEVHPYIPSVEGARDGLASAIAKLEASK